MTGTLYLQRVFVYHCEAQDRLKTVRDADFLEKIHRSTLGRRPSKGAQLAANPTTQWRSTGLLQSSPRKREFLRSGRPVGVMSSPAGQPVTPADLVFAGLVGFLCDGGRSKS
jgi:hypothetical protein